MKKILLSLMAVLSMSSSVFSAETTIDAGVKMTYINGSATTTSYGEVTTAYCGYNKISDGTVALANSGWGVNNIAYVQVDASAIPAGCTITNVTLTADLQQLAKRGLVYGCGYNSSAWSSDLTWDTADRSITLCGSTVSCGKSSADLTGKTFDITDAFKNDADNIATILVYQTAAGGGYITNVSAAVTYSDTKQSQYTVKFVDIDNNEIKTSEKRSEEVDGAISLIESDKASFFTTDNSVKYIYVSDDSEGKTVTSDNAAVVTVKFRKADTYNYTINGVVNGSSTVVKAGSGFEGETVTVTYPTYQLVDGTLYSAGKLSSDKKGYYFDLELTEDNISKDITYGTEVATDIVYYKEAEEIEGLTACANSNTSIRSSNGASAYAVNDPVVVAVIPAAGKYKITSVACDAAGKNASAVFNYTDGDKTIFTHTCSSINWDTKVSDELLFASGEKIYLSKGGKATQGIDCIYIQKTSDNIGTQQTVNIDVEGDASGVEYTESFTNKNVYFEKNEDGTYNVVLPELKSEKYNCTMAGASFINFDPTSSKALTKAIGVTNGEKTDSIKNITVVAFTNDEENDFYLKLHGDVVGDKEGTIDVVYSANMLNTNNIANFEEYTLDPESVKYFENEDAAEEPVKTWKSGGYTFSTYTADYGDWGKYYYSYAISDKTTTDSKLYNYALESACGGAVSGSNYAVWYDNAYNGGDSIKLDTPAQINGFYVTNTTSVVDAILNGDGMSVEADGTKGKPFGYGNANDELTLSVIGYKNGKETGAVDFKLAYTEEGTIYYAKDWMWFDLTSLGVVDCVKTTMSSTKANAYGMTSPTYFCMDDLGGNAPEYAAEYASYNPTAVNSVNAAANKVMNGKFFKNGQVIIVKNGKQYNAAGAQMK